jgi:hypothetical protein
LFIHKTWLAVVLTGALSASPAAPRSFANDDSGDHREIRHVLLISIDGMHAVDYLNCAKGISGANGGTPYCPALAELRETGINYRNASTSKPSDSFPGLTAIDAKTVTAEVQTAQVAPTILRALRLDPDSLDAVRAEGTAVLPAVQFHERD